MKSLTITEIEQFLKSVEPEFDLRVPIRLHDGTRSLGGLNEGPLSLMGGKIPLKPTSVFFPQTERVFTRESDGEIKMEKPGEKPILVVGYTAEDADCLEFIDKFFSENFRDDLYFQKRDGSVIMVVSGKCGPDGGFLKIAGGKCDLELICDGERFIAQAYTEKGRQLEKKMKASKEVGDIDSLKKMSDELPDDDLKTIQKASELILAEKVPDAFWVEIGDRCIACTSCNYACPTCTCFEVYDRVHDGTTVRERMWDSCQLDGFMREASGHNPMGTEDIRTRRRIHHKLAADVTRWGHLTCYLCGRCDDACPTNIGIKSVSRMIVERYSQANEK
ncbi:4Fe-4S dicluster domain-containing protein [Candidatus Sumerlaeota bacterium]|nr:4Fe-4S dicluster domain-containing protein [Candidatus Sumerlaeota bacterium]